MEKPVQTAPAAGKGWAVVLCACVFARMGLHSAGRWSLCPALEVPQAHSEVLSLYSLLRHREGKGEPRCPWELCLVPACYLGPWPFVWLAGVWGERPPLSQLSPWVPLGDFTQRMGCSPGAGLSRSPLFIAPFKTQRQTTH